VQSEKMVEIQFDAGGKPVRNGDQFGIGRVVAKAAAEGAAAATPQAAAPATR
jgi:hypothetical protein